MLCTDGTAQECYRKQGEVKRNAIYIDGLFAFGFHSYTTSIGMLCRRSKSMKKADRVWSYMMTVETTPLNFEANL